MPDTRSNWHLYDPIRVLFADIPMPPDVARAKLAPVPVADMQVEIRVRDATHNERRIWPHKDLYAVVAKFYILCR